MYLSKIVHLLQKLSTKNTDTSFESYAEAVMKLSSAVNLRSETVAIEMVHESVKTVLKAAFDKASSSDQMTQLDNTLFVYMGLVKVSSPICILGKCALFISLIYRLQSEDKKFKPTWPLSGFLLILERCLTEQQSYIPSSTIQSMKTFLTQ